MTPTTIRRPRLGAWRHAWYVHEQLSIYRPPKKEISGFARISWVVLLEAGGEVQTAEPTPPAAAPAFHSLSTSTNVFLVSGHCLSHPYFLHPEIFLLRRRQWRLMIMYCVASSGSLIKKDCSEMRCRHTCWSACRVGLCIIAVILLFYIKLPGAWGVIALSGVGGLLSAEVDRIAIRILHLPKNCGK